MIKTVIFLLKFPFKCRLINEIRTSVLVQASKQANQLTSAIDCVENIFLNKFYRKLRKQKIIFCQNSKETCSLMFVSAIKMMYQENTPFVKTIHMHVFH